MAEEKVYYRCVEEHSQRQLHLGESRVDVTRLSWAMWGDGEGKGARGTKYSSQKARGIRTGESNQNALYTCLKFSKN